MYRVIQDFVDAYDKGYLYRTGDIFPRDGADASGVRIAELAGNGNKLGHPLIAWADNTSETEKPRRGRRKMTGNET